MNKVYHILFVGAALVLCAQDAHASVSTSTIVWEVVLSRIASSLSGSVATSCAICGAVFAGLSLMIGGEGMARGLKSAVGVVLGFSIATCIISILSWMGLVTALM